LESGTRVRQNVKELKALNKDINSMVGKLRVRHKRRDEAYQRIFKLYHVKVRYLLVELETCDLIGVSSIKTRENLIKIIKLREN
jgi:hypothetical protein